MSPSPTCDLCAASGFVLGLALLLAPNCSASGFVLDLALLLAAGVTGDDAIATAVDEDDCARSGSFANDDAGLVDALTVAFLFSFSSYFAIILDLKIMTF